MVTTLSKLVEMTQGSAVPRWLRDHVLEKREEISEELKKNGTYTIRGPNGDEIVIQAEKQIVAA